MQFKHISSAPTPFVKSAYWGTANRKLIAKTLSELHFEELLMYEKGTSENQFVLNAKHVWQFNAHQTLWGMLVVEPLSITVDGAEPTLAQFFLDIETIINITAINLSGFLEEIQQTLYSEMARLYTIDGVDAKTMVSCDEVTRQKYLDAHPKLIANKGRLGWGVNELAQYAPETSQGFPLHFLAVKKTACQAGVREDINQRDLLLDLMNEEELSTLVSGLGDDAFDAYYIMAVHPWQVARFLYGQYTEYFIDQTIIDLGVAGKPFTPQQSIRTLSDASLTSKYDVKTAVTIINTSCYRGVTGKYIAHGARVSAWIASVVANDPLLAKRGMHVQQEFAGYFCPHPYQSQFEGAYRYNEMLGCVWRDNVTQMLPKGQRPLSMATLMQADASGKSCLQALIGLSSLDEAQWLNKMFEHVLIPLYHLMCQYGVGLVAHGQNITLVLNEKNEPCGCTIKDFHGDLRLVENDIPELDGLDDDIKKNLVRLPGPYLAHDLITGHFVTVLRFVSVYASDEKLFYKLAKEHIETYQATHPELKERFTWFDILKPKYEKLCVNKVRFKLGLADSDERPLPDLATPIDNPMMLVE